MAAPRRTVWEIKPHTRAKHEILKRYLQAWIPILTAGRFPEVMYIDGFAGPGRYSKGEEGSPVIALRAALEQQGWIQSGIHFLFIENDRDSARILKEVVGNINVLDRFRVRVVGGQTFATAFGNLVDSYERKGETLPPIFAFIDPFGWKGVPFSIIEEIMGHQSCEVLITFMYEEINRFIGNPNQERNFDSFFGTRQWREGIDLATPRERNQFFHNLYLQQLRDVANARYVRSFEMRNAKDVTDYYLFYATNNIRGLMKMKEAMWKVDETGEFGFSDATDHDQLVLFKKRPDFDMLRRQILARFSGCEATVGEIEEFVLSETAFRETHYKRHVLRPLERSKPPLIEAVDPPPRRRIGTYGDPSLRLRFLTTPSAPQRLL